MGITRSFFVCKIPLLAHDRPSARGNGISFIRYFSSNFEIKSNGDNKLNVI